MPSQLPHRGLYGKARIRILGGPPKLIYPIKPMLMRTVSEMGYVDAKGTIGSPRRTITKDVEFLVDTGAFHTAVPKSLAETLKLEAAGEIQITLADKREIRAPISLAYIRLLDRESILPVVIIDVPKPLLGVTALEGLGLKVDPVSGTLEHARPFGAALL